MNPHIPEKIIKDTVHGYIHIDSEYCKKIIDTPNFQRLKRLEQTNTRPLYPCAHHDRFVHSLGTFHLGKTAFRFLKENSEYELKDKDLPWSKAKKSFEIACLLHDVGHSPFSHTFEAFYEYEGLDDKLINESLISTKDHEEEGNLFFDEYKEKHPKPSPHEKVSALLVLTEYINTLSNDFSVNPFLIARMILGIVYKKRLTKEKKFYNCLIELLNGTTIDVDKLDYLARDQWATGHVSKQLDYERLLSSMYIKEYEGNFVTCFHKRAINEILSLIEIKKLIKVSLHSHHIVKYDEYVLRNAVEEVLRLIEKRENKDSIIGEIFSLKTLDKFNPLTIGNYKFQLLTDDDLIHVIKANSDKSMFAKEWFSRDYQLKALWKTFADYKYFFKEFDDDKRMIFFENRKEIAKNYLSKIDPTEINKHRFHIEDELDAEYNPILTPDIKIFIKNEILELKKLRDKFDNQQEVQKTYFLLYFPKELCVNEERDKFIKYAKQEVEQILANKKQF